MLQKMDEWSQGPGHWGRVWHKGHNGVFWGNTNSLCFDCGVDCMTIACVKTQRTVHKKMYTLLCVNSISINLITKHD